MAGSHALRVQRSSRLALCGCVPIEGYRKRTSNCEIISERSALEEQRVPFLLSLTRHASRATAPARRLIALQPPADAPSVFLDRADAASKGLVPGYTWPAKRAARRRQTITRRHTHWSSHIHQWHHSLSCAFRDAQMHPVVHVVARVDLRQQRRRAK